MAMEPDTAAVPGRSHEDPGYGQSRMGRMPPQDVEAERSVLGSMLLEEQAVSETMAVLHGDDFYRPAHGRIFEAMATALRRHSLRQPGPAGRLASFQN